MEVPETYKNLGQECPILSAKGQCGCRFSFQSNRSHTWLHLFNQLSLAGWLEWKPAPTPDLGIHLVNRLAWMCNTEPVSRKGQSRLHFKEARTVPYDMAVRIPGFHPSGPRVQLLAWELVFIVLYFSPSSGPSLYAAGCYACFTSWWWWATLPVRLCWNSGMKAADTSKLNKFIRRVGEVAGTKLDSLESVV